MVRSLVRDLMLAVRGLARRPVIPTILVAVVAVGVAFLTTAFGVFDALLWRQLPYGDADRYVMIGEVGGAIPPMPRARGGSLRRIPRSLGARAAAGP